MSLAQLSGEWPVVEGHGDTYLRTARAIEQAIVHLHAVRDEDATIARAFDRVRDAAGEVSAQIDSATSRYRVTGQALVDYAEALRVAQADADEAIEQWDAADARVREAVGERERVAAAGSGDDPVAERRIAEQQAIVEAQAAIRADAEAAWHAAREHKAQAAALAESRIRDEIVDARINDTLWDDVRGAVAGFLEAVADALVEVLEWLAAIVLTAVAVVVVAALALALAATGLIGLILGGLALALLTTWVLAGGAEAFIGTLVATGSLEAALLAGAIGWLRGTLPRLVDWLIAGDAGSPTLLWQGELPPKHGQPGSWGDLLARLQADNRAADAHSGGPGADAGAAPERSSMVTVTAVTGADGETVYRVSVPSTQQWLPGTASINDIHSGVAAKLGDDPTQLEQAVRLALAEVGVPRGASLLLSGWSLGGITAANLAGDPGFAADYDIDAVIVAGASVDDIDVPAHIPLLAFEHAGGGGISDPVPHTEDPAKAHRASDPNRTVVRVPAPEIAGAIGHHGLGYQQTMQEQGDARGSGAHTWMLLHDLERYFVGLEQPHASIWQRGG